MPALPHDDEQFAIDEETLSTASSQTESLIAASTHPNHLSNVSAEEDDEDDDVLEKLPSPVTARHRIVPPTREQIEANRLRGRRKREGGSRWRLVVAGLFGLFIFAWGLTSVLTLGTRFGHAGPKVNVILMISDGMGPASESMARVFLQYLHDTNATSPTGLASNALNTSVWSSLASGFTTNRFGSTPLDNILVGASRTRSSSSLVTDSAAGATVFSCGIKTYNGAIGVEPVEMKPCGTILEAAKRQGFATGLVTTARITHATPASFYAHVVDRDLESEIAGFLVGDGPQGRSVDLAFGGGLCFFTPNSTDKSCRTDEKDMLERAKENGYDVLQGTKALRTWHEESDHDGGPVLALFSQDHMEYEIDRQQIDILADEQPSLKEMSMHALKYLDKKADKGFFLMIEGARIDMAGHNNDAAGHVSDILAYLDAVHFVKNWVKEANVETPTLLISVSDHETGGLALGRQLGTAYPEYAYYPDALNNATHSSSYLGQLLASTASPTREYVRDLFFQMGINDVTEDEVASVYALRADAHRANLLFGDAVSRRAQVGWSTHGHSGVDVNLYAYGFNATGIAGNRENTEIGEHIAHVMGLNLDVVTIELNRASAKWHQPVTGVTPKRRTEVDHYHGDF